MKKYGGANNQKSESKQEMQNRKEKEKKLEREKMRESIQFTKVEDYI